MDANNPKQEKPNLSEWSKKNPGMSLNDYYRIYGANSNSYKINPYFINKDNVFFKNDLNQKKSNYSAWQYLFLAIFILITFLSNPKTEDHREALKIKITGLVEKSLSKQTNDIILTGLGKYASNFIIDEALKNVSSDNYIFFSLTKLNYALKSNTIGFGILGKVYISEKAFNEIVLNIKNK